MERRIDPSSDIQWDKMVKDHDGDHGIVGLKSKRIRWAVSVRREGGLFVATCSYCKKNVCVWHDKLWVPKKRVRH